MALAVPVPHTTTGEHVEVLTFDFPTVTTTGTQLRLRWGTTTVPLEIGVAPSMPAVAMTTEQLAPYLGNWGVTFAMPTGGRSPEMKLAIVNAKGALRGIVDAPGEGFEMQYIPTETPYRFLPAFLKDGKIMDVEVVAPVDFKVVDGRAVSFTAMFNGKPFMEGSRKN
jgi:hypothetical protein